MLSRRLAGLLKLEDLSANQYNVLRILRGSPDGLPCGEIGIRMITRDPDITRLLDRLEKSDLIRAVRDEGPAYGDGNDHTGGVETAGADRSTGTGDASQPVGPSGTEAAADAEGNCCRPLAKRRTNYFYPYIC